MTRAHAKSRATQAKDTDANAIKKDARSRTEARSVSSPTAATPTNQKAKITSKAARRPVDKQRAAEKYSTAATPTVAANNKVKRGKTTKPAGTSAVSI